MNPQSPIDAVAPAFRRLGTVLLPPAAPWQTAGQNAPFRFWFFVKVAAIAALTQASFYGVAIGVFSECLFLVPSLAGGLGRRRGPAPALAPLHGFGPVVIVVLAIAATFGVAAWIVLGWLWSRLRFTLFDLVVYRHGRVGLGWSRYPRQAWRYFGMAILIALVFLLFLALTAGPVLLHFILSVRGLTPEQLNANPFLIFGYIFPLYGIILFATVLLGIVDCVMQDFLLPPMAMEDAPVERTAGLFFRLLRHRPGPVILYMLLRFAIQLGMGFAGGLAVIIVAGIVGLVEGGAGFFLYRGVAHAGPGGSTVFIVYCVLAVLAFVAAYLGSILCVQGTIAVFRECYAVQFYGGYYPPLGNQIDPPGTPWPAVASPAPPPPPPAPFTAGEGSPAAP